jgi:hypothetical protein
MVHPMWSLEEGTENSPGRKAGVRSLYILRPEGPIVARPGRKAGIKMEEQMSAEGAAQNPTSAKLDFQGLIY